MSDSQMTQAQMDAAPFYLEHSTTRNPETGVQTARLVIGGTYGPKIVYYLMTGAALIGMGIIWLFLTAIFSTAGRIMAGG